MHAICLLLLSAFALPAPASVTATGLPATHVVSAPTDSVVPDKMPLIIVSDEDVDAPPQWEAPKGNADRKTDDGATAAAGTDGRFVAVLPVSTTADTVATDSVSAAIISQLQTLAADSLFLTTQLGLYVYDLTTDTPLFGAGQDQRMRPASCQKVVTSVAALYQLDTDYLYRTRLFTDGAVEDSVLRGNLFLRGGFDPLIDRYDVQALVESLKSHGVSRIEGQVYFDRSLKDTTALGWGWCWDDEETPLTPLLFNQKPGLERRFLSALHDAGFVVTDTLRYTTTPRAAELLAERTHTIDQVLLQMMKESDNLFAESLFYQIGAQAGYPYADYRRSVTYIKQFLAQLGIDSNTYQVADGSGLSLYNYLTPRLLVSVLRYAHSREDIWRHFEPSLPVAGVDGTLKSRLTGTSGYGNVRAKTGSVTGISSLAGYCTAPNGHTLCFAIINQGVRRTTIGRAFQDRVCKVLTGE
ncbi:MAG: D-alanyl-D-alanine carboxypeptidase/D-alanyl-D-alanine-endopeptidase [Bacteroidales bacterium]|nr:D-alanyl-D-alanine carboxypeptidase/D-alanyl-D-alanine-endopeptidase [Bacteroidales bacterium]